MIPSGIKSSTSHPFSVPIAGAVAATVGDFLMLGFALGAFDFQSSSLRVLLIIGTSLGALLIPTYYLGYRALAERLPALRRRTFYVAAASVAGFGALTHGLTGFDIYQALAAGAATRLPAEAFGATSLLTLAAALAAAACVAAAAFVVVSAWRNDHPAAKAVAIANPILGTIILAALAKSIGEWGAYLEPAAPNLAHLVFFAACARMPAAHRPA